MILTKLIRNASATFQFITRENSIFGEKFLLHAHLSPTNDAMMMHKEKYTKINKLMFIFREILVRTWDNSHVNANALKDNRIT